MNGTIVNNQTSFIILLHHFSRDIIYFNVKNYSRSKHFDWSMVAQMAEWAPQDQKGPKFESRLWIL